MNKAFTKEEDASGAGRCPRCGGVGEEVGRDTLDAFVPAAAQDRISATAFFCPAPHCEIVYFDAFERSIGVHELERPIYPKDPEAPICGCFGLSRDDVEADAREGFPRRCREVVQKSKGPQARCAVMSASGRPCVADVQRCYQKALASRGP